MCQIMRVGRWRVGREAVADNKNSMCIWWVVCAGVSGAADSLAVCFGRLFLLLSCCNCMLVDPAIDPMCLSTRVDALSGTALLTGALFIK